MAGPSTQPVSTDVAAPWVQSLSFVVVASRAYVLAIGLFATLLIGFPDELPTGVSSPSSSAIDLPMRWDSEWLVGVARSGYEFSGSPGVLEKIAFFPAYPLTLRFVGWVTGAADSLVRWNWTGVVLSTIFFAAALWYLSRLADLLVGPSTGYRAALLCVVYPWSIYFGLPYTESLFLLACCAATYRYMTGRHLEACLWGLLAGLTRPTGILLAILLGLLWIRDAYRMVRETPAFDARAAKVRQLASAALVVCGPLIGLALYSVYVHGVTGDPLTWAKAQEPWGRVTMNPFWVLGRFANEFFAGPIQMARVHPYALVNGLTGIAVLALAIPVGRRVGWAFAAFLACGVLIPIAGGGLASLGRYTAILFPLFIYLAYAARKAAFVSLVSLSLLAQGLISALFFTWRPVY